jgi:murein L,D-transpeptidase YcbB/YkuD
VIVIGLTGQSCKPKVKAPEQTGITSTLDSTLIAPFLISYPELNKYEKDLVAIYRSHEYNLIWFDNKGVVEFGYSLYSKVKNLDVEGISTPFPYQNKIDEFFSDKTDKNLKTTDAELLLSSLYLFYLDKVYKGLDKKSTTDIGWLLPRKKVSYVGLLDSSLLEQKMPGNDSLILFSQYYKLREVLRLYRAIELKGGWKTIVTDSEKKTYKPGDTASAILQIRERLFVTGDIKQNNLSNKYDAELVAAVKKFKLCNGYKPIALINPELIQSMNVLVSERIKTLVVNMERCRWISPEIFKAQQYIFVNIPSYNMEFIRDGIVELKSPVVLGDSSTQTSVFAGKMSYIIFSPYWNVPKSIIEKEIMPGIKKNKNYLKLHNMEWNNGHVRQKPGKKNSLGLVKFMFPNTNDIYLHDTPAKGAFNKDNRAISHGCVRVEKARELAYRILEDYETWTHKKIDAAMNASKESKVGLKKKIPVSIGYFTAWVDDQGEINFYKDVYEKDERLAALLFYK